MKVPTENPPQKFVNFHLTPQKDCRDQRMPTGLMINDFVVTHQKNSSMGGGDIKWNCP